MRSFDDLRKQMSTRARAMAQNLFDDLIKEFPLGALRNARGMTQEQVAAAMGTSQVAVSKMESRRDFLLSSLNRYVKATGGALRITISYGDSAYEIKNDADGGFVLARAFAPVTVTKATLHMTLGSGWSRELYRQPQGGNTFKLEGTPLASIVGRLQ